MEPMGTSKFRNKQENGVGQRDRDRKEIVTQGREAA